MIVDVRQCVLHVARSMLFHLVMLWMHVVMLVDESLARLAGEDSSQFFVKSHQKK